MSDIKGMIASIFGEQLAEKILLRYKEGEEKYYQGDFESSLLKFGKFAELIKEGLLKKFSDKINSTNEVDFKKFCDLMESLPPEEGDSPRKYIPRLLRSVYDLRSGRGGAHEGEIDPNTIDATLSYTISNWILAEIIRILSKTNIEEARQMIASLFYRRIPFIEEIEENQLLVLIPNLSIREEILLLLYYKGRNWVTTNDLNHWIRPKNSRLITNILPKLNEGRLVVYLGRKAKITARGIAYVEQIVWPSIKEKLTFRNTG